jgi:hypothetical protein
MTDLVEKNDLALSGFSSEMTAVISKIETAVRSCRPEEIEALPQMTQALLTARALQEIRTAMDLQFVQRVIMPLQGTRLGFKTDRDKDGGYAADVVRDAVVEALLRGFRIVGNEMNIIGGNFYATLEGLERKINEFPGLTNLSLSPGVPEMSQGNALVTYHAKWILNGEPGEILCAKTSDADMRIPVRIHAGNGHDLVLGKAKRKMLARIFQRISGVKIPEGDIDGEAMAPARLSLSERTRAILGKIAPPMTAEMPPHNEETGEVLADSEPAPELATDENVDQAIAIIETAASVESIEATLARIKSAGKTWGNEQRALIKTAVTARKKELAGK